MTAMHPGAIVNASLLQLEEKYLKGTNTVAGFEANAIDTYLHKNAREKQQFEFVSEEIWEFVNSQKFL